MKTFYMKPEAECFALDVEKSLLANTSQQNLKIEKLEGTWADEDED